MFGTEQDPDDPRYQSEAIGDNAMLASDYGVKNLKFIMPNVIAWTKEPDKNYDKAASLYSEIVSQWGRYAGHVAKYIAGIYRTPITVEQIDEKAEEFVPANLQKEAMQYLDKQVFATPEWLIDKTLVEKAAVNPITAIGAVQKRTIDRLISRSTIDKLVRGEIYNGKAAYTVDDLFRDLKKSVWSELSSGKQIDIYRRNLQKSYVDDLIALITPASSNASITIMGASISLGGSSAQSDAPGIARVQLMDLQKSIKSAAASASGIKRSHLIDLDAKIKKALDPK